MRQRDWVDVFGTLLVCTVELCLTTLAVSGTIWCQFWLFKHL